MNTSIMKIISYFAFIHQAAKMHWKLDSYESLIILKADFLTNARYQVLTWRVNESFCTALMQSAQQNILCFPHASQLMLAINEMNKKTL